MALEWAAANQSTGGRIRLIVDHAVFSTVGALIGTRVTEWASTAGG